MPKGYYEDRHNWTEEEDEFLHDNAGYMSNKQMADALGRSECAVKLRRCRKKMPTMHDSVLMRTTLAGMLGVTRATLRKWNEKGLLACREAHWKARYGNRPKIYREQTVVRFLRANHHRFPDPNKIPDPFFRNVVKKAQDDRQADEGEAARGQAGALLRPMPV